MGENGKPLSLASTRLPVRLHLEPGGTGDVTLSWNAELGSEASGGHVRVIRADGSLEPAGSTGLERNDGPLAPEGTAALHVADGSLQPDDAASLQGDDPSLTSGVRLRSVPDIAAISDGADGELCAGRDDGGRVFMQRTGPSGEVLWTVYAAVATITVAVQNISFSPANVTVATGDTVKWSWRGGNHSTTSGSCPGACAADGKWNSGIKSSGSFSKIFNNPGTFHYFCLVHGAMMQGTVTAVGEPFPFTCEMTASPQVGEDELTVTFSAQLDGDPPYTVDWDFGDGTSSIEVKPTHTYTPEGLYTGALHAVDTLGRDCLAALDIIVTPCVGRTLDSVSVTEKKHGAVANLKVVGIGFQKGDVVQIDSGSGFVDLPRTKVKPKKLTVKGIQDFFPAGPTVQVRVRQANNCVSASLPASR